MGLFSGDKKFKGNTADYLRLDNYSYWGPSYEIVVAAQDSAVESLDAWLAFIDEKDAHGEDAGGIGSHGSALLAELVERKLSALNAYSLWRKNFPHADNIGNPRFGMCNQTANLIHACVNAIPLAKAYMLQSRIEALYESDLEEPQAMYESVTNTLQSILKMRVGTSNFDGFSRSVRYEEGFTMAAETAKAVSHYRQMFDYLEDYSSEMLLWLAGTGPKPKATYKELLCVLTINCNAVC